MNEERRLTRPDTIADGEEANLQPIESLTDLIDHMTMGAFTRKLAQRDLRNPKPRRRDDDLSD